MLPRARLSIFRPARTRPGAWRPCRAPHRDHGQLPHRLPPGRFTV